MTEEEKFKIYLRILNQENSIYKKEEAMRGLLDLYNEIKETNASLQKEIKLMKSININDNYISKDKIRDKIKKLEQKIYVVTPDRPIIEKINEFKNEGALNILEELLEE